MRENFTPDARKTVEIRTNILISFQKCKLIFNYKKKTSVIKIKLKFPWNIFYENPICSGGGGNVELKIALDTISTTLK